MKKRTVFIILGIFVFIALITAVVLILTLPHETPTAPEPIEISAENSIKEPIEEVPEIIYIETVPESSSIGNNCSLKLGNLMLINPNYTVPTDFIAARKSELISLSKTYGIPEYKSTNGDNLMDAIAASHLNDMLSAYASEFPGHSMGTRSCFRSVGTNCGRLCLATGTSDHHSGFTCDLIDNAYGTSLDTDTLSRHLEWQWLHENSYKFGFIDRYPLAWAGSSMSQPMVVNAEGSTGLYESWHYRYVGIPAAIEIAEGLYNNGAYDSLEHYLLASGHLLDLLTPSCAE